ncbi:MAG: glutathione S-transferase family protein [Pseudomonadota bacterium]
MYTLYDGGNATRTIIVKMVMAEGDIAYQSHSVDILKNENFAAEFLAINPAGFVPVLVKPDGEMLSETPAINLYLAEQYKLLHLVPAIDDPERGQFLSGLFFLTGDIEPILKRCFYPHRYVLREMDTKQMRQHSFEEARRRLALVEQRMQKAGPYFLGQRFSLLDIILLYWVECVDYFDTFESFPAIRNCTQTVANRPTLRELYQSLKESLAEFARRKADGEVAI